MERSSKIYQTYIQILKRELIPAAGCTEPIAIAYCAAVARSVLGCIPNRIHVQASGNIIKNVKSVIVPNTGGLRGIEAAAAIGVLAGDEHAQLEVLSHVSDEDRSRLPEFLQTAEITVSEARSEHVLDITVDVMLGEEKVRVRSVEEHTNIVLIEKNGQVLLQKKADTQADNELPDYGLLNVEQIYEFAETCHLEDVESILKCQISYNEAISNEGLQKNYGANIGKTILTTYDAEDVRVRARARAAAGSDARMGGCELPVVINSGSGNQGLTASLPVIEYAKHLNSPREKLYRALLVSNLVTLHEKSGIGRLSAYCGAISAGAGAGAGIAYLNGGNYDAIAHTIVNTLAIASGVVCDGAKPSCAAKIAVAVDAGILGYEMYRNGQQFLAGEGLVLKGVENTIRNISRLGRVGMKETDHEIIQMMIE